tara:strand:+ start:1456 stop:1674 length:219 start_codon:yes stop_codon:yes gene_type:complete
MLVSVVRSLFKHIGCTEMSESDILGVIRVFKLDKLPPHYIFMLSSILPVLELVIKKLLDEQIDYSALVEGTD